MTLFHKQPDLFVIRGTAKALENMGELTASRIYNADHNGDLLGDVRLAKDVTMLRIRASVKSHSHIQQNADESAATAVSSISGAARLRLRMLMEDALAASGRRR